jgi:hypothetical protein
VAPWFPPQGPGPYTGQSQRGRGHKPQARQTVTRLLQTSLRKRCLGEGGWDGGAGERLPTTGVTGEAVGVVQAPHCLARLPRSINAEPTLDADAYGRRWRERAVVGTLGCGVK